MASGAFYPFFFTFSWEQINLLKHLAPCDLPGLKEDIPREDETLWRTVLEKRARRYRVGWGAGSKGLLSSAGRLGRPLGRLGDLTLREAVIWENSSAVCPEAPESTAPVLFYSCWPAWKSNFIFFPAVWVCVHLKNVSLPTFPNTHTHSSSPGVHKEWETLQNITKRQVNEEGGMRSQQYDTHTPVTTPMFLIKTTQVKKAPRFQNHFSS